MGEENRIIGAVTEARLLLCVVAGVVVMVVASFLPLTEGNLTYVFFAFVAVCGKGLVPDFLFQGHEDMGPITTRFLVSKSISTVLTFVLVHSMDDIMWVPVLDILSNGIALAWSFAAAERRFGTTIACVPLREALAELRTSGLYCFSNMAASVFSRLYYIAHRCCGDRCSAGCLLVACYDGRECGVVAVLADCEQLVSAHGEHGDYRFARKLSLLALPAVLLGTALFCLLSNLIMLVLGGEQYLGGSLGTHVGKPTSGIQLLRDVVWLAGAWGFVQGCRGHEVTVISALFCIALLLIASFAGVANLPCHLHHPLCHRGAALRNSFLITRCLCCAVRRLLMAQAMEDGESIFTLGEIQGELLSMLKVAGPWFSERGIRYSLSDGSLFWARCAPQGVRPVGRRLGYIHAASRLREVARARRRV